MNQELFLNLFPIPSDPPTCLASPQIPGAGAVPVTWSPAHRSSRPPRKSPGASPDDAMGRLHILTTRPADYQSQTMAAKKPRVCSPARRCKNSTSTASNPLSVPCANSPRTRQTRRARRDRKRDERETPSTMSTRRLRRR